MGLGNEGNADDVFFALKDALFGPWAWLLVVAVMISAVSSTQTTILPTARGTLAMAVYKALPKRFATVHPRYRTPSFSTLLMGVRGDRLLRGHDADQRQHPAGHGPLARPRDRVLLRHHRVRLRLVLPADAVRRRGATSGTGSCSRSSGALLLTGAFVYSAIDMLDPDYGYTVLFGVGGVFVVGVGSLLLGAVLMVVWSFFAEAKPFFRGESLNRDTEVLVPDDELPRSLGRSTAASERRRAVRATDGPNGAHRAAGRLEGC